MPIYEYRCASCGHELEVMQKVSDPAPAECPKCGQKQPLERLMSRSSFHLKGGGWYSDLYASTKKDGAAAPAGGGSASAPATTPAPAAPSTPAAAPAAPSGGSGSGSGGGSSGGSSGSST